MEQGKRRKRKMSFTTVGGSSILTIFAVLMFVVFALLSLSTAKANAGLTDKSTNAVTNYYRADTEAEEILAHLRAGEEPVGVRIYKAETTKSGVKRIVDSDVAYIGWDKYATFNCKIDDNQELQCAVLLRFNKNKPSEYQIVKWMKDYTGEWEPDTSMPVFDPDSEALPGLTIIDE